jgi:FkbM family methyltransferase
LRKRFHNPTVAIVEGALADKEGVQEMEILNWDYSSSLLPVRRDIKTVSSMIDLAVKGTIQCRVRTLDAVLRELDWTESIDLLKIDVQGAELVVLRGATQALMRTRLVFTEVSFRAIYEGSCVFHELYNYLCGNGFKFLALSEGFRGSDGELLQGDALFLRAPV